MREKLVSRIGDFRLQDILELGRGWSAICFMSYDSVPCDHFKPEFLAFAQEMKSMFCAEIVAEENPVMCERLGVTAVPTTVLIKDREKKGSYEGPYSREALLDRVRALVNKS